MAQIDLGIDGLEQFKLIGRGGFAAVYAAWDSRFRRWVAVKVLDALDDDGRRRFERELGLMGQFDNEVHIVTPYRDGYTSAGSPYLVMEYLAGGSLQDLVDDDGPIPVEAAIGYVVPIAEALGRAHSGGVLHRDVKPANILLTANGVPKLTDFGIATIREATATQVAFTLAHSPPETFGSGVDARDERSDLYSLASTLYTLVAGRAPFEAEASTDSQLAYMRRIEADDIPPTGHDALDEVLRTAMAKSPEERYPHASRFATALTDITAGVAEAPPTRPHSGTTRRANPPLRQPVSPAPAAEPTPGRAWRWVGGGIVLAALIVLGLLVLREPADDGASTTTSASAASSTTSAPAAPTSTPSTSPSTTSTSTSTTVPTTGSTPTTGGTGDIVTLAQGSFTGVGSVDAAGDALVLNDGTEQRFLRFENFEMDNGPDLRVYLRSGTGEFVDLGELKGNIGNQNYEIPSDVDLGEFTLVQVWDRSLEQAFAEAVLGGA